MFTIELSPAPRGKGGGYPGLLPAPQFFFGDFEPQFPRTDVEPDEVPVTNERKRSANRGFGAHVKDYGAVRGTAHSGIGNTHHILDPFAKKFRRQGHIADFSHAGISLGATVLQNQDTSFVDLE